MMFSFNGDSPQKESIDFPELIQALLDNSKPFAPRFLYRLSGLESSEVEQFFKAWPAVDVARRRALLEDLENLEEANTLVSFKPIFENALGDEDPQVRGSAIRSLWEHDDSALISKFINLLDNDPVETVRAQAAAGLGKYVWLGELEEISSNSLNKIVEKLLAVMTTMENSPTIRSQALTSLGYSSHPKVEALIEDAYESGDEVWLRCALIAMERSAEERWAPQVINNLYHEENEVRLAAINAAGELEIGEAAPVLIEMLQDNEEEIRWTAAWALSKIGGDEVQEALENALAQTEVDEEMEVLENALDNLAIFDESIDFNLFDFSEDDLEDMSTIDENDVEE